MQKVKPDTDYKAYRDGLGVEETGGSLPASGEDVGIASDTSSSSFAGLSPPPNRTYAVDPAGDREQLAAATAGSGSSSSRPASATATTGRLGAAGQ